MKISSRAATLAAGLSIALLPSALCGKGKSKGGKSKGGKSKGGKSKGKGGFGPVMPFHQEYVFLNNDSPLSIVFDSKGYSYIALGLISTVSVLDPNGIEVARVEIPVGDCRPDIPLDITFPLKTLIFGMTMDANDDLYLVLLACADYPFPDPPNPNSGLWKMDTDTHKLTKLQEIPNVDSSYRGPFCCDWMTEYWPASYWNNTDRYGNFQFYKLDEEGKCVPDSCVLYEAWTVSQQFFIDPPLTGSPEIWNGVEVIGDYVYVTNSVFHEIWRMRKDGVGEAEVWMGYGGNGEVPYGSSPDLMRLKGTAPGTAGFNGIKYHKGSIYLAVTSQGKVVRIPMVEPDDVGMDTDKSKSKGGKSKKSGKKITKLIQKTGGGTLVPGTPQLVYSGGGDVDEFTLDKKGNIYAALLLDNKVIKVHAKTGDVEVVAEGGVLDPATCNPLPPNKILDPEVENSTVFQVDVPASVAFGTTKESGKKTLFIANSGFFEFKSCVGFPPYYTAYPGVTKVDVGEKGDKPQF